VTHQANQSHIE